MKKSATGAAGPNNPDPRKLNEQKTLERYMGLLFQTIPSALLRFDRESRLVYCSNAFLKLMGVDDFERINGRSLNELHQLTGNAELAGPVLELFDYLKKGNETVNAEVLMNFPGIGGKRLFTIQGSRLVDDDGVFDGVFALCHDGTEAKNAESEKRTRTMLDATPLACFLMDGDGQVYDCNMEAINLFGTQSKQEFRDLFFKFMPEYQPNGLFSFTDALNRVRMVIKTGDSMHFEWYHVTSLGRVFPAEVTVVRVNGQGGWCVATYVRDLTELKANEQTMRQKEQETQEAEERTLAMLNATPLACSLWDEKGNMIDCNQEALDLLGVKEKSDYINGFFDLNPEYQSDGEATSEKAARYIKAAFETGYQCFDWMYRTAQGEPLPVETTLRRISWKGGYRLAAYSRDLRGIYEKEKETREAEERVRAMLDATPLACTLWDKNAVMIDCNQEALDLFGLKDKADYLNRFFALNPEFQPDGELTIQKSERLGKAAFETGYQRFDWMYRTIQGESLPAETILRRIRWKGDYLLAAYSRDLREFIAAQNEKNEAEERMRRMLDTSPLICTMWDGNLNLIDCNQETLRVFGVTDKEEFLKTFPLSFIPEYQSDGSATHVRGIGALQTTLETGYYQFECTYLTARGELLPTETILIRIAWKDSYHIIVYCRDLRSINEKEKEILQAEEELRLKRNHLDLMADINKFTYWEANAGTDKITFSYHLEREFGYSPGEITKIGVYDRVIRDPPSKWIDIVHPDDFGRVMRDIEDYVSGVANYYRSELRMRHKNGAYLWAVTSGRGIKWKDGKPVVVIGGIFNIDDLKRTESANTAKSRFLASMSHEIRTPMNAIIGMSDLIRMDNMDARQKEFFHDLRIMSRSLLQIINDILDFSKIESNKMELALVHFDLLNLYDNIVSLNRFMAENKGLEFRYRFDDDVPHIVYGDDLRIRQIVTNLLGNAIKYTEDGFVDFQVKRVTENDQVYTAFQVEDSGIGVREEHFSKLFDWYEQFDTPKNRGITGTGLGLPITKRFTDMMHGHIDVKSTYGKGSVFTVLLPLPEGDPDKVKHTAALSLYVTDGSAKVLVVDDNAINLKVAVAYLEKHNIRADAVESGIEALKKIKEKQYHLIFMDHMMPEMDGIETTARIRGVDKVWHRTVPIIALSANAVSGARELFLGSGMNDFLYKPIDAQELNRLLVKWLPPEIITPKPLLASTTGTESLEYGENNGGLLIDRTVGIANAVGSKPLYQQLLTDFKFSHSMDMQNITTALEAEDQQSARRIAHTLKSTANLIGAKTLGAAALAVEKALEVKSKAVPLAKSTWDTLEKEFNAVMAELELIAPAPVRKTYKAGDLDITRALAFIQKLEPLLKSSSASSLNLLDTIREVLAPAGEEYEELIARIEDFDFPEAAEILNQIREKIAGNMPLEKQVP
ncbi:MAG: PAS domain S-box protein [Treponema sp.]|nr:PAS domain S-box protein [Treponema sp.]